MREQYRQDRKSADATWRAYFDKALGLPPEVSFTHLVAWAILRALATCPRMNDAYAEVDGQARGTDDRSGRTPAERAQLDRRCAVMPTRRNRK